MADPLSCDKDGHLAMEGEAYLLEGRGVGVSEEVVNESSVLSERFCTGAIAYSGTLDDAFISAAVVNESYKTFVENGDFNVKERFRFGHDQVSH